MRITQELKNRIEREIALKYSDLISKVEVEFENKISVSKEEKINKLQELYETEPVISALYNTRFYRKESFNAREFITYNEKDFFPVEYREKQKALDILHRQKKLDYEELAINISYEKDLDGIKKAFEKLGLTF